MISLCSNCLKNDFPLNLTSDTLSTPSTALENEDPISKALSNLQAKIKLLEAQRNDKNVLLSTDLLSKNKNAEFCFLNPILKDIKSDSINDQSKAIAKDEDVLSRKLNDIDYNMEKKIAHETLKLAEEKCEILENQLSAMKSLFLKEVVAKEDSGPLNYVESDAESSNQIYEKSLEELISNSDSGVIFSSNKGENNKMAIKKKASGNINKVDLSKMDKVKSSMKMSKPSKVNNIHLNNHPFILGCSTAISHNSAVKSQINRRTKIQDQIIKKKLAPFEVNQIKDSAFNNLRTVYFSLCDEYENLFNKKLQIVDSLNYPKIKDLNNLKILDDIAKSLRLKAEQIRKMKMMIKTFTKNHKNNINFYSIPSWNI